MVLLMGTINIEYVKFFYKTLIIIICDPLGPYILLGNSYIKLIVLIDELY